jgi:outer membrane protein TolC
VQLAWKNNPETSIAREGVDQSIEEVKAIQGNWSTMAGVTGNLNEFSIKRFVDPTAPANQFYPRYNVFIQLPLSLLVQNPHLKKAGRFKVAAAEDRVRQLKLELRSRVLKLYSEYKMTETIANIRKQSKDDEESIYRDMERRFSRGEAQIDEYLRAQRNRNDLKIQMAVAENQFQKAKLDLEAVIGIKLEDVR